MDQARWGPKNRDSCRILYGFFCGVRPIDFPQLFFFFCSIFFSPSLAAKLGSLGEPWAVYAGSNRRVQEVVRVKQKKIEIQSFSNGLNHRGSFCGVRLGFNFSAESPFELRFCSLTSDRCVGARVSLRSRRWFFLCGWPPVSVFRNETLTAFFFL